MKKFASSVVFLVGLSGCGGTTTGNPLVTIEASGYSSSLAFFSLIPSAEAAVSSLSLCFKRIRFKAQGSGGAGDTPGSSNFDFAVGEVVLGSSAKKLGTVSIPAGNYRRLEFDLSPDCGSGKTIQVLNGNGSFSSNESISVRFDGSFAVASGDKTLSVSFQSLVDQMNTVASNGEIKAKAEAASGGFQEK